jgi:YfiH family protein
LGGVSEGPYASLNLGRKTGDKVERVDENRRRACAEIDADAAKLALNYQVHSILVHRAQQGERGGTQGDGLWTDEPALPVLALAADCLPIVLVRANGAAPAVCVLHAGRIGLLDGIVEAGVATLGGNLVAAVGPSIGACCYEVGEEVAAPYRARFGAGITRGPKLDLRQAAERLLSEAGVARIERFDLCTACNPQLFFSHRRDGKPRGVQGVVARVS